MKRIIAAVDALKFSIPQMEAFNYITRQADGELTVLFLENITGYGVKIANSYAETDDRYLEKVAAAAMEYREKITVEKINELKNICSDLGLEMKLKEASGHPGEEVVRESSYADLLLINHDTSFALLGSAETDPPVFVKDMLAKAQCPVIVMPETFVRPREIIFSYNGSSSSMYAIRRFTNLFPEYWDMPVTVVYVDEEDKGVIPGEASLKAYLEPHYEDTTYTLLKGSPSSAFLSLLRTRRDCIVTFGAYGRNPLSRFFHRSDADSILRTLDIPLFITHP